MEMISRTKHSLSFLLSLKVNLSHRPLFELIDSPKKNWFLIKHSVTREAILIFNKKIPELVEQNQQYLKESYKFE